MTVTVLAVGCTRPAGTTAALPPGGPASPAAAFDTESEPFSAGKKALVAHGCFRCHAIDGVRGPVGPGPAPGGSGPMRGGRGPDLGTVGEDSTHTVEWLMNYVRDPKAVKPNAKMPAYQGKASEEDLRALAEYLASLK
jgi:mono/diheme cytochrome c family protein